MSHLNETVDARLSKMHRKLDRLKKVIEKTDPIKVRGKPKKKEEKEDCECGTKVDVKA